jgi:hypothetical protein
VIEAAGAGRTEALAKLEQALADARAEIDKLGDRAAVTLRIVISEKPR